MALRKIKLTVSYDGSEYSGWQIQPNKPTIQGTLIDALTSLTGGKVHAVGASRTDAGVSAIGQQAVFEIDSPIPTENFPKALNSWLPADIAIIDAEQMPLKFDVIGQATNKHYRYSITTTRVRPVLHIRHCWHIPANIDIETADKAAKMLVGTKDFKSFASAGDKRENSVRTISRCDVTRDGSFVYVDVEGNKFLYNMVRNIVGTLVEVGLARMKPENMEEIINARDRRAAGPLAPAHGLCLMRIDY